MDVRIALRISSWMLLWTVVGLAILGVLGEVIPDTVMLLWVLVIPPVAVIFPARKYLEAQIYLSVGTRLLAVGGFLVMLVATVALVFAPTDKLITGSWPIYLAVLLIEAGAIFFMLSMYTVKEQHT